MNSSTFESPPVSLATPRQWLGPTLYGALFALVLPVALFAWAHFASDNIQLPAVRAVGLGTAAIVGGALLLLSGIISLWVFGRGLPMNPYPPPRYVSRGAYAIIRHPIYTGFVLVCFGTALATGSASGLWLVSPVVFLCCLALVLGYENIKLRERFGPDHAEPFLHLPDNTDRRPCLSDRLSIYFLILIPWLVLYELLAARGLPSDAVVSYLPFELRLPVWPWTEALYVSTYGLVLLAPLLAGTRRALREFAVQGLIATLLMALLFAAIPLIAPPRPLTPDSALGQLLAWERQLDTAANAFPSYHVFWVWLSCSVFAARLPRWRGVFLTLAAAVTVSCITTGMHSLVDIAAGLLLFVGVRNWRRIWEWLRQFAERIANSWQEWQWGGVRLINHGLYAGVGAALAVAIVGSLLGPERTAPILLVALTALVTSALWAQFVEGCPSLLRPYGYYGGVLGIILGSLLASPLFGVSPWLCLAAYSVAGPWVQSFGRLRCLVQGCCHGGEAPPHIGIIYRHPRSRVCRLSTFGGIPIHPTPLYSILWNIILALLMTRLWFTHAPLALIGGLYLILTGVGRFVEEAYRGEPQTRSLAGLRFYQWLGLATLIGGAIVTCLPSATAPTALYFTPLTVAAALSFGLLTWAALGVDFPGSGRRFARLT